MGEDFIHQRHALTDPAFSEIAVILQHQNGWILNDVVQTGRGTAIATVNVQHLEMGLGVALLKFMDKLFDYPSVLRIRSI